MSEQLFDFIVRYVFEGTYTVSANSLDEAKEKIHWDCGLVMGGHIHTTLDEKEVEWEFPLHPETKIVWNRNSWKDGKNGGRIRISRPGSVLSAADRPISPLKTSISNLRIPATNIGMNFQLLLKRYYGKDISDNTVHEFNPRGSRQRLPCSFFLLI